MEERELSNQGETWYKTWDVGLPKPADTPGNLNIPIVLWLGNLMDAFDMTEYAAARYNLLGGGSHWFPGARADHLAALDLSRCLQHSPHQDVIPKRLAEIHQRLAGAKVKRLSES